MSISEHFRYLKYLSPIFGITYVDVGCHTYIADIRIDVNAHLCINVTKRRMKKIINIESNILIGWVKPRSSFYWPTAKFGN